MNTIAILGLGAMGSRMAKRLLDAGFRVVVYHRAAEKMDALLTAGAIGAATPRQAAEQAGLVLSMVTDIDASRALWLDDRHGAVHGLKTDAIAVESSTVTPAWIQTLADQIAQRGAAFLDAPVVGSRPQAQTGQLIFLVGGNPHTLSQAEPILRAMASAIHRVGPTGQGTAMKLAVNGLFGIQVAAAAELLAMTGKWGLNPQQTVDILATLPITSPAIQGTLTQMTARNFAPLFPIHLVAKDFGYIETAAAAAAALTPCTTTARKLYAEAVENGLGDENISGVLQLFEGRAG